MGADVMRWQYCAQPPDRNLLFGFGPAHEIKRKLLTFWNSTDVPRRLREHRGLRAVARRPRAGPPVERPLDRWLVERTHELVARGDGRVRGDADRRRDPRLRVVRRRPLELVHPPLAPALLLVRRGRVPHALVRARPVPAGRLAGDAVPRRPPVAEPRARRAGVRASRGVARGGPSRTAGCSPRSPRCGASSSSAARPARPRG